MAEVVIVGCGEVGVAYADGLRGLTDPPEVRLLDPAPCRQGVVFAERTGLPLHGEAGDWLAEADILLLATPGAVLAGVLDSLLPHLRRETVVADMSTASAEDKQHAAERCGAQGAGYVDIAITGSVAATGSATPLLYAGRAFPFVLGLFERLGAPVTRLDNSRPGDAMRVKLLRSVIMKGLEALAVECLPAAEHYGVLGQVWTALADVDRIGFTTLLVAMLSTHPRHAARREHEVGQAAEQLETAGFSASVTRAVKQRFTTTAVATFGDDVTEPRNVEEAIRMLEGLTRV